MAEDNQTSYRDVLVARSNLAASLVEAKGERALTVTEYENRRRLAAWERARDERMLYPNGRPPQASVLRRIFDRFRWPGK